MNENLNNQEKERARMETEMRQVLDAFFSARPHFIRTSGTVNCSERLFEAAYQRGWEAKSNQLNICGKAL